MKNITLILIGLFIICASCNKEEENTLVGSYIGKSLKIVYSATPSDNVDITFNNNDCVDAGTGFFGAEEYCRKGRFIIKDDNTFSSTIEFIWNLPDIDTSTPRYWIKGQGNISQAGNTLNICFENSDCIEFTISGNTLTYKENVGTNYIETVLIKE